MKRIWIFLLFSLPLGAQVTIRGGTIIAGGSGGGCGADCAYTSVANTYRKGLKCHQRSKWPSAVRKYRPVQHRLGCRFHAEHRDGRAKPRHWRWGASSPYVRVRQHLNRGRSDGSITTGAENTGIGLFALGSVVTGLENTGVGSLALADALGNYNTAIGESSLNDLITGDGNTAIGWEAGCGSGCDASSGPINSMSNGVYIGALAAPTVAGLTNQILIGYGVVSGNSNQTVLGNDSITAATIYGIPTFPSLGGSGTGCIGINNAGLTSTVSCGSSGGGSAFQVNGTPLTSSATVNFENGSGVAITNPICGEYQHRGNVAALFGNHRGDKFRLALD